MSPAQRQLGQILIEMGILDERKVNEALEHQKRMKPGTKIGQAMVELGFCDEVQIAKGLCRQFRLPFVDLSRSRIPQAVADLVPKKIVQDFGVVPVKITGYAPKVRRTYPATESAYVPSRRRRAARMR